MSLRVESLRNFTVLAETGIMTAAAASLQKASSDPAYHGPAKGMPQTGDATMPMAIGMGLVAVCAAALAVFSARSRRADGKHVK